MDLSRQNRGPLSRSDSTEWAIGTRENQLDHNSAGMCCRTHVGCVMDLNARTSIIHQSPRPLRNEFVIELRMA